MYSKELDDKLLKEGLNLFHDKWVSSFPNSEELENVSFSERFKEKMERLIVKEKNGIVVFAPVLGAF